MFDIFKYKKIILGIVGVIAMFFLYQYFFVAKKEEVGGASVILSTQEGVTPEERTTLQILSDMQSIKLDATVLQSPAFIGLEDFSLPLEAEPQGRSNPFAPLGATTTTVVTPAQVVPAQTGASMKTMTQ